MNNHDKKLLDTIRDILDRNNFNNQKIDLQSMERPPNAPPIQDAFRIRVTQPLRFGVELVKPKPMKDFLFVAGRLNISPQHQEQITKLDQSKQLDLLDEIRLELGRLEPTFKFHAPNGQLGAIETMMPVILSTDEQLPKDLFGAMDAVNKAFFQTIMVLQRFLRTAGFTPTSEGRETTGVDPFYQ